MVWTAVQVGARRRAAQRPAPRSCDVATIRKRRLILAQRIGSAEPRLAWSRGVSGDLTAEMSVTGGTDALVYFGLFQFDFPSTSYTKLATDLPFQLTTSIAP